MVKVTYYISDNEATLIAEGHAEFDLRGKDIVCSAISAVLIGGLNALSDIDESFEINIKKGYIEVKTKKSLSTKNKDVFDVIITQLATIEDEFPENLKLIRRSKI